VALGTGLRYLSSSATNKQRHERELRAASYADYSVSVGEMEIASSANDSTVLAHTTARAITAKARICLHGSKEAVEALAAFEGMADRGLTPQKKAALLRFLSIMRKDLASPGLVSETDMERILFKNDEPAA
jgi:hypothetical protein